MPKHDAVRSLVVGLGLGLSVCAFSVPRAAAAKSGTESSTSKDKKRVIIGGFTGPRNAQARKSVLAALKEDGAYDIVDSPEIKPGADDKTYAEASNGASAVLVGTVKKSVLVLSVRNGADGALVQDVEIKADSAAKLGRAIDDNVALSVAEVIAQTKAEVETKAAEPEPEPTEEASEAPAAEETSEAPAEEAAPTGPSAVELTAGLRATHRRFNFHDTPKELFPTRSGLLTAPTYTLPLGPALFVDGAIYPFAFGSSGAAAAFGLAAGYEINIGTKSAYGTPERTLTTRASQYYAGLKGRIPLGVHEVHLLAAYGKQTFELAGDEDNPVVPDVAYRFVRLGAEGRFRFGEFSIGLHAGTRLVSKTGAFEGPRWFPGHVKTQALEAGIAAGYSITPHLEFLVGFDLTRYAFNLNPATRETETRTRRSSRAARSINTLRAGLGYATGSAALRVESSIITGHVLGRLPPVDHPRPARAPRL